MFNKTSLITNLKSLRTLLPRVLGLHHCFSVSQVIELYRLLAVGISLWNQFAVPVLFTVFWFVLFIVQLCSDTMSGSAASAAHQGIMFFLLTRCVRHIRDFFVCVCSRHYSNLFSPVGMIDFCSVSECCATPYSLLGLTFVVSYLALGLLNLCKFYLGGYAAVQNENVMHRWDVRKLPHDTDVFLPGIVSLHRTGLWPEALPYCSVPQMFMSHLDLSQRCQPGLASCVGSVFRLLYTDPFAAVCSQRSDWGRHSAPAGSSDRPVRYAGSAAHLPPQHHPLHRGDFNPAVHDWNNRSDHSSPGCITQQVAAAALMSALGVLLWVCF